MHGRKLLRDVVSILSFLHAARYLMLGTPFDSHSPEFDESEYSNQVRVAFSNVQNLQEEFNADAAKIDSLCPGVREQLNLFSKMAEKHAKNVAKSVLESEPSPAPK